MSGPPTGASTVGPDLSDWLAREGVLLVLRGPHAAGPHHEEPEAASPEPAGTQSELFVAVDSEGIVTAFNGHVDLGTGIRTALAQIVAEELDVPVARVAMVLGDTTRVPNQGATIASETIQVAAIPLRQAAASARRRLLAEAATQLGLPADQLAVEDGVVRPRAGDNRFVPYGDLVRGRHLREALDPHAPVKPVAAYTIVGAKVARVDIPAKADGSWTYVHDVRVPGMLHGRVVRPPYAGVDAGPHVGTSLIAVDEASVADVPGLVAVVVEGDFVGVVCEREEHAARAMGQLRVSWRSFAGLPDLNAPEAALRANPATPRVLLARGDVDGVLAASPDPMRRTYVWPYQMHGSIGPSCAVAALDEGGLTVWSGTQNPHLLRGDLARLLDLPEAAVSVVRHEAAGCYGRNCADDVTADAALLARAVGRPVRVQLTREQEHAWEPKGAAQVMDVAGGLDGAGRPAAYDFATRYPSNGAPTLALLLTGRVAPVPAVFEMGDRTAIPPYRYDTARVVVHDMAPIARASWLRGVSALPNSFAHESYVDELAAAAGVDPVAYRVGLLDDPRATDLIAAVTTKAEWVPHITHCTHGSEGDRAFGRGFAYAVYVHGKFPGTAAAWSAWVTDVTVDRVTGEVDVTRVVVGQDTGLMINPDGVRHQIHGNVIQSASRALKEAVRFDARGVTSREWGAYPIITFPEVPAIDVVMLPRPHEPPLGAGESAAVPSAAAIANAIYDATGVRMRELPFTPERVRAALGIAEAAAGGPAQAPARPRRRRLAGLLAGFAGAAAALLSAGATLSPWRPGIAAIPRPDAGVFSPATIARGRQVAAVGACAVCHVGPDGTPYAGGRGLETPFGTVYATNVTPDETFGIGGWSYPAFERAMREGVSRDGHHLYPAHPYTGFTRASDADLQALYAYLMTQGASATAVPATRLAFPFGWRPLMAGWNALFLRPGPLAPEPSRSPEWNRGRSLVEGLGHCGACHTPRNALGAARGGEAHLAGALADGWEAPALAALSVAPAGWSEASLFAYLRTGHATHHGVAAGPMAEVVAELGHLPDADIRAMAHYLAALNPAAPSPAQEAARAAETEARSRAVLLDGPSARLYAGACAACHEGAAPEMHGLRPSLALNTGLHGARPDNLIRAILNGIATPLAGEHGAMPAYRDSLDNRQVADLAAYLRARFAPDKGAWPEVEATVARVRGAAGHGAAAGR